jgi:hypothetical protein
MTAVHFDAGGNTDASVDTPEKITPIPVMIVGTEQQRTPKFRSTHTVETLNAADPIAPQRLLPQAPKRHRAVISSRPLTGAEVSEFVLVGSAEQVANNRGYKLWNGEVRVIESSSALYVGPGTTPPTHTISVSVLDERYE